MRWILLLLFPLAASAEICLRAPQTSAEEFLAWRKSRPECAESVEEMIAPFRENTERELDDIFIRLKKSETPAEVLESFLERKKEKFWTPQDLEMIPLVLERWGKSEQRKEKLEVLQAWRDLIESFPSRKGLEGLSSKDGGWSDFVILANGRELKDEERAGLSSVAEEKAQWVLLSSLYQPIIHWGSKAELLKRVDQERKTWLGGDCQNPKLFFSPVEGLRYQFFYPDRCVAQWPAGSSAKILADAPGAGALGSGMEAGKLPKERPAIKEPSVGFWIVSAVVAGVMINQLSTKRLVIQPTRW